MFQVAGPGPAPGRVGGLFAARTIMAPLSRHSSLKETKDEALAAAGIPLGDPLSTDLDYPERRPAVREAQGLPEVSGSARAAGPPAGPLGGGHGDLPLAVDAMGGDHAPDEIVAGALAARREHGIRILLTGPAARLRQALAKLDAAGELVIVPAEDNLAMNEGALASLRRPRARVGGGCQLVRRGEAAAVVSAGSTGGIVATARLRLRPLPGVLK